ncbi:uncharacterized protein LOC131148401 [Malania oleifera]|uniref:uncharacterized protein LOC131148401 n=1 Tax=Malania oleifera TaxID=397392 RepID=UPI0025AE793E|nr:uncharacterized protein LOC131148401 [Malania oleifera]
MDPGGNSAHTNGDDGVDPSSASDDDSNAVLHSSVAWKVREIEKILTMLHCIDEQRVLYATYKLIGAVERWWTAVKLLKEQRPGQLMVQQYTTKFIKLSRFAPYMVPNDVKKARMFEKGLRHDIHRQVAVLKVQYFFKLVDRATVVEEICQRDVGTSSQRKRPTPLGFQAGSSRGPWRGDRYGKAPR